LSKIIIGLCGVIGSGKDYLADKYVSDGYVKIPFAYPLKKIIFETFKIKPDSHNTYEMFKENYWNPTFKIFPSFNGRDALQLGNVARKILGEDIWINAWEKSIQDHSKIVVSDVRYYNEAKRIVSLGGKIIYCNYRSIKYNSKIKLESEKMAQELLLKNFQHNEDITQFFIKRFDQII
jgi:hypothetical protein